jgi:hypothetical protein
VAEEIQKYQEIIIMSSDVNLNSFGFNFIETLYAIYFDKNYPHNRRVQQIIHNINTTPDWLDFVTKQALEQNIPLAQAIQNNAEYYVNEEAKKAIK